MATTGRQPVRYDHMVLMINIFSQMFWICKLTVAIIRDSLNEVKTDGGLLILFFLKPAFSSR